MTKKMGHQGHLIVGHLHPNEPSMAEMRKKAMERYHDDYGFKRGVRPGSPDRDSVSYNSMKNRANLDDHFYGLRDRREIKMMMGEPHGFAHARTVFEGHTAYGSRGSSGKGHRIGKR